MHKLKDLKLWQRSIDLSIEVYRLTGSFPADERYGLTSQIRRSAVSIPSNIAEGAGRNSNKEFRQFLGISNGSSYELQTQIIIAQRLELIDKKSSDNVLKELDELQKMTYAMQERLEHK